MEEKKKISLNYLFYGALFVIIWLLSSYNIYLIETFTGARSYFLIIALGQALCEVLMGVCIGYVIERYFGKAFFLVYIGLFFTFSLRYAVDFILIRFFDMSFWEILMLVLQESKENFVEMLKASNLSFATWFIIGGAIVSLPIIGITFFLLTEKLCKRWSYELGGGKILLGSFVIPFALLFWDFSVGKIVTSDAHYIYQKRLPWKATWLQPKRALLTSMHPLQGPKMIEIEKISTLAKEKGLPNIYFFILESMRSDFITEEITPHLAKFSKEEISFDYALSNANGTHLSWFSIFYSTYPHHWASFQKSNRGSPPLQGLKKMGYRHHVLTSAGLDYYDMKSILFGKEQYLLNSYAHFPHPPNVKAYEADQKTLASLKKLLDDPKNHQNSSFFFFWDASHFDYSFPKNQAPFQPIAEEKDYFLKTHSVENLELIKNSYRNALHFLDGLFGSFVAHLKEKGLYQEAIIVLLGDHGEEFYEKKRLFHASHLSSEQTHIPLFIKASDLEKRNVRSVVSQIDIFPSLFDLLGQKELSTLFDGSSIFDHSNRAFAMSARYNMSKAPYEFFFHDGKKKVLFRFSNRNDIYASKSIEVLRVTDTQDNLLGIEKNRLEEFAYQEFKEEIKSLFKD